MFFREDDDVLLVQGKYYVVILDICPYRGDVIYMNETGEVWTHEGKNLLRGMGSVRRV